MCIVRTRILSWVMFTAFLGVALFPPTTLNAQIQKIRIAYSSRSNTITPLYIAASKGFFREEGLEVELIQVSPRLGAMAVMNGDVSFTTSFVSTFRGILQGLPLKVILIALKTERQKTRSGDDTRNRPTGCRGAAPLQGIQSGAFATARHRRDAVTSTSSRSRSSSGRVGITAVRSDSAADGLQSIGRATRSGHACFGFVHLGSFAEGKSSSGEADITRLDEGQPVHR